VPRCLYFNLPGGCRRGEGCKFKHIHRDHEGEGQEEGAMAVDDLSAEMASTLRFPKHGISFGRRMQDHRRGP
jgi:hypothetical protein